MPVCWFHSRMSPRSKFAETEAWWWVDVVSRSYRVVSTCLMYYWVECVIEMKLRHDVHIEWQWTEDTSDKVSRNVLQRTTTSRSDPLYLCIDMPTQNQTGERKMSTQNLPTLRMLRIERSETWQYEEMQRNVELGETWSPDAFLVELFPLEASPIDFSLRTLHQKVCWFWTHREVER